MAQDKQGVLYFATTQNILQYDGVTWRQIPVHGGSAVRVVARNGQGVIYTCDRGEFGYLAPNATGMLEYRSLMDKLPPACRNFTNVWNLYATGDTLYLNTGSQIIRYSPRGVRFWQASKPDNFHTAFLVNGHFYVREYDLGLEQLVGDSLQIVPGGELFADFGRDARIDAMMPYSSTQVLIGTRKLGMFLLGKNGLTPFPSPVAAYLDSAQVYQGTALINGGFAFATLKGGVALIDHLGRITQVINRRSGLKNENVHCVYQDMQGSLWLALDRGISHVEAPSPISTFGETEGLLGTVNAVTRSGGRLYVGTTAGLYVLQKGLQGNMFVPIKGDYKQVWALVEAGGRLLAASSQGVFEINMGKARRISTEPTPIPAFSLLKSSMGTQVFVGQSNGIASFVQDGKRGWEQQPNLPDVNSEVRWLVPEDPLTFWAGNQNEKVVLRINLGETLQVQSFTTETGLPEGDASQVFPLNGHMVCPTGSGVYRYDPTTKRFVPDFTLGEQFGNGTRSVQWVLQNPDHSVWVNAGRGNGTAYYLTLLQPKNHDYVVAPSPLRRLGAARLRTLYSDADGVLWIGGEDQGLYRYDPTVVKPYANPYVAVIRQVVVKDSVLFGGHDPAVGGHEGPNLKYALNSPSFDVAAMSYDADNHYQFQLEGYDTTWTRPNPEPFKRYTNLPEGSYIFRARARNAYGILSNEAMYRFSIAPPWFRTWWAYLLYLVGGVGLVFGFVRWRLSALEAEKQVLEQKVQERTAEVVRQKDVIEASNREILQGKAELENAYEEIRAQNENLTEANQIIEEKNKDITDSINYAKRIQEALLPAAAEIAHALPNSFVLLKPKDIVSGDFYWFNRIDGHIYIAAVDCTGHGVPGGFMSMLGNSLLNQILVEGHQTNISKALSLLDEKVKVTLRQNLPGARTKDGMEVAMLRIDETSRTVTFCGANRPLVVIRAGEMIEYDGNKVPIGGVPGIYEDLPEGFLVDEFPYLPGDVLYTFSDGYGDQFGGPKARKFFVKNLKALLMEIHTLPMEEQRTRLDETIEAWRGNLEQIDDILVIGIRL